MNKWRRPIAWWGCRRTRACRISTDALHFLWMMTSCNIRYFSFGGILMTEVNVDGKVSKQHFRLMGRSCPFMQWLWRGSDLRVSDGSESSFTSFKTSASTAEVVKCGDVWIWASWITKLGIFMPLLSSSSWIYFPGTNTKRGLVHHARCERDQHFGFLLQQIHTVPNCYWIIPIAWD